MTTTIKSPKKLIEVALPLDDINAACAREKSIRQGHPSALHLWWARRPLAAARAVIFSQLVNDPGYERSLGRGVNKEKARIERERLFDIIRKLVLWENINNEALLREAREEIKRSWRETCELNRNHPQAAELFNPDKMPAFHDPFAGGGAIPIEAQRLGLDSTASDLNPVAVILNKATIEIPGRFAGKEPIGPVEVGQSTDRVGDWRQAQGLAEDLRRYGAWLRAEALKKIGHLYPSVEVPRSIGGGKATPIAYLWARTVKSPNPAFSHLEVPLASTFVLSSREGKEVYVEPVVSKEGYTFAVHRGTPPDSAKMGTKLARGANFRCVMSDTPINGDYIKAEGVAGRMGTRLLAVIADGEKQRVYLAPTPEIEATARTAIPEWVPSGEVPSRLTGGTCVPYGLTEWGNLFTARQLVALNTFSDLVAEAREKVLADTATKGWGDDGVRLADGGRGATAYADAIALYLGVAVSRTTNTINALAVWSQSREQSVNLFSRQAIPMAWDFPEVNPFAGAAGDFGLTTKSMAKALDAVCASEGTAVQADAQTQSLSSGKVISTDPPYYDNIAYADLSDFFYVWLRRSLRPIFPDLFATMAAPKAPELVAAAYRHGGKAAAESFFLNGMTNAMHRLAEQAHPAFPTTIYYAFKQSETSDVGTSNTGWETFLAAVISAGFSICGTWPLRTERPTGVKVGKNALASSIVLVCRKREATAATISRREFLRELKEEMTEAVEAMIGGVEGVSPVAPVDLAQAAIGPGMAIFSKYSAVLEADGSRMSVHTALTLINRMLTEGGDEFDADTHFCLGWFDEMGWGAGEFGKADVLARAKGTSVDGVRDAGVIEAASGKVRLLKPVEYPGDWSPETDARTPVWEALHQLIRALQSIGESAAGELLARLPQMSEPIRSLAYRLYTLCERKGWADEARGYNELITSWLGIEMASHEAGPVGSQTQLDI
ncbi:DUF1156 domain-containing protein [Paraburkholderia haematera]|uniref:DUF1156 domain-containing protein n=1 Tax=Paraburkholderia haematera TaxID=2793077 RepID=A0ABM8SR93_9BURK|nr:DUF1156 domain-containing protein [Paraburkholderia haematera]CAE6827226.1 hypothetical protein R69888_06397 [Paraburkholderia haematera]